MTWGDREEDEETLYTLGTKRKYDSWWIDSVFDRIRLNRFNSFNSRNKGEKKWEASVERVILDREEDVLCARIYWSMDYGTGSDSVFCQQKDNKTYTSQTHQTSDPENSSVTRLETFFQEVICCLLSSTELFLPDSPVTWVSLLWKGTSGMRSMRRVVLMLLISECIYAFDHQHEVNENPESLILTQSISSTSSPESLSSPATSSSDAAQWQDGGKIFVGQVDTDEGKCVFSLFPSRQKKWDERGMIAYPILFHFCELRIYQVKNKYLKCLPKRLFNCCMRIRSSGNWKEMWCWRSRHHKKVYYLKIECLFFQSYPNSWFCHLLLSILHNIYSHTYSSETFPPKQINRFSIILPENWFPASKRDN